MALFKLIHLLAVVGWLGGMFFAYMVLRPSAAKSLPASSRLKLWEHVFQRFFNWVWGANFLLLTSGLFMIYQSGGLANAEHYVQLMLLLGILMLVVFCYLFFFPFVHFSLAVSAHDWLQADIRLKNIRQAVATNLLLGGGVLMLVEFGRAFAW